MNGESHRQPSLAGYNPWGHKELDMTAQLYTHCLAMPTSIVSWIHHTTSYPGTFAQVFTLLEGSNSSSACLCSPYLSFKTKLKHLFVKIFLIPTLSPLCQQTWRQDKGPGPFSAFSGSDYCSLKFLTLTWFLLQSLTIRPSAVWEAGNQLCSCETFDWKQDSRLLKCELCKLHVVQWGRRTSLWAQIWRLFLVYEHLCRLPIGVPYLSAPA